MSTRKNVLTLFFAAVLAFGLAACGGGSTTPPDDPPPPPTPYEMAMTGIAAADTAEAAQAAYDAVKDDVTAAEGDRLQAAVDARVEALATMARAADQRAALMMAAGDVDTSDLMTQADIDAAKAAIAALQAAIGAAVDVDDTSMYESQVTAANMAVTTAQDNLDTQNRMTMQSTALSDASTALQTALGAISGTPTQAQIDDAQTALDALNAAITGAADLDDTSMYELAASNAQGQIDAAKKTLMANMEQEEADRKAAEEEAARIKAEEEAAAAAAMAVLATKLYDGISAPTGDGTGVSDRFATYGAGDNSDDIAVTFGDGTNAGTAVNLSEDDDAMVASRHGWTGMMFTAEPDGDAGTYEAAVYSHVGDPTEGAKFSATYTYNATPVDGDNTELTIDTATDAVQGRVASSSFDQSAGIKEFELGANLQRVMLSGTYHGVSGTYSCTPAASSTCAAQVTASGFQLGGTADADNAFTAGGGAWTFRATDAETRLMDVPDANYASYGWWLHKSEDDKTYTASAFHTYKGTDEGTVSIATLVGTAKYTGGAAGKYALRSLTGGTNDAGHFTADVELNATFAADHKISGTVDNFMDGDGEELDWSVELKESTIGDDGPISSDGTAAGAGNQTVWTIGEDAADDSGAWSGALREQGDDGIPGIATGTFHSTYGSDGQMVGAFGANETE